MDGKTNMKRNANKYWVLIGVFIMCIRIFYIWMDSEIYGTYYFSGNEEAGECKEVSFTHIEQTFQSQEQKLNSIEIMFGFMTEIKEGNLRIEVNSSKEQIYRTGISMKQLNDKEWRKLYLNLLLEKGEIYTLSIIAEEATGIVKVFLSDKNLPKESVKCKIDGIEQDGQLVLRYGYFKAYSNTDKMIKSFGCIVILMIFVFFLYYMEVIQKTIIRLLKMCLFFLKQCDVMAFAVEGILCALFIEYCGLEIQPPVKAICYLFSAVACVNIWNKLKWLKSIAQQRWSKIALVSLNLYGAFALVGNRLFVYPLNQHVKCEDMVSFFIVVIWFCPILVTLLYGSSRLGEGKCFKGRRGQRLIFICTVAIILIVPAGIALYAFNPAISTWDTAHCLSFAHHIKGMQDWHPPIYVCFLKVILKIWDSTYAVVLVQLFFWTYVMLEGILFLRAKGHNDSTLLIAALLVASNAANYLHICTIWKDVPYALAILWLTILIARIVLEEKASQKYFIYAELFLALFMVGMMRQNGIVAFILTGVILIVVFHKNRKILVSVVLSFLGIICVKGPFYHYLDIQPMQAGIIYTGLGQDVLGVYYAGGDISADTMDMVISMTAENPAEYAYNPYFASSSAVDISKWKFIANYLDTFVRNPITMIRAVLCRQDVMLDVFDGQDNFVPWVNYTGTIEEDPNWRAFWEDTYAKRKENAFTYRLSEITAYTAQNQLIRVVVWRAGLAVFFALASMFLVGIKWKNRKVFLIYIPLAGHMMSLVLSSGWSDFRYYWPINLMVFFICLLVPVRVHR